MSERAGVVSCALVFSKFVPRTLTERRLQHCRCELVLEEPRKQADHPGLRGGECTSAGVRGVTEFPNRFLDFRADCRCDRAFSGEGVRGSAARDTRDSRDIPDGHHVKSSPVASNVCRTGSNARRRRVLVQHIFHVRARVSAGSASRAVEGAWIHMNRGCGARPPEGPHTASSARVLLLHEREQRRMGRAVSEPDGQCAARSCP